MRISHRLLTWITIGAAVVGQMTLDLYPQPAVLILGIALAAALIDGWYYLQPIGPRWWFPVLLGVLGLTMWQDAGGWFLIAWALIEVGTGLRATQLVNAYLKSQAEEKARRGGTE